MKKTLIIFLFFASLFCKAQKRDYSDALHYYAGALTAYGVSEIVYHFSDNNALVVGSGLIAGIGIGMAKERFYDDYLNKGVRTLEDELTTAWGACGGALSFRVRIGLHDKKKRKQEQTINNFKNQFI